MKTWHSLVRFLAVPLAVLSGLLHHPHAQQHHGAPAVAPPSLSASSTPPVRTMPTHATRRRTGAPPALRRRVVPLDVTAYSYTGNRTASGVWPGPGQAASNQFKFGTRLLVPGIGEVRITDRIGAHSELDIFMTTVRACRDFGRRRLMVTVLP